MLGRTHLLFGLILGVFLMHLFSLSSLFVFFVLLGSVFPDLDHPRSLISGFNFVFRNASKIIRKVIGHRTYLHTIEAGFLFSLLFAPLAAYFNFDVVLSVSGFFVGFAGHLFLDSFTKSGVPLTFSGVNKHKKYGLRIIRTGSVSESWFFIVLFFVLVGLFL